MGEGQSNLGCRDKGFCWVVRILIDNAGQPCRDRQETILGKEFSKFHDLLKEEQGKEAILKLKKGRSEKRQIWGLESLRTSITSKLRNK